MFSEVVQVTINLSSCHMPDFCIETEKLRRTFKLDRMARSQTEKTMVALDNVNLQVRRGELFGLLGPNGAGKTTLIRILATLLSATSGTALVEGFDVRRDIRKIRSIINMVSGGETCGYGILTATENLRLFTELYGIPWKIAKPRVEKMMTVVGLDRYRGVRVNKLSTGIRQRVNFARGFTTNPKVLFLDEPTVGLDVHSAREIRDFIKLWLSENSGTTILLTTHYMAEADELCDRVAIIDKGKVQVCDKPSVLKHSVQKETALEVTISGLEPLPEHWSAIEGIVNLAVTTNPLENVTNVRALASSPEASGSFIREVTGNSRRLLGLRTIEPTLEDVFIKLTGRRLTSIDNHHSDTD